MIALTGLLGSESFVYALISVDISGVVTDFVLEGPSVVHTAMIISNRQQTVADALSELMGRAVTRWPTEGTSTHERYAALYCTVS